MHSVSVLNSQTQALQKMGLRAARVFQKASGGCPSASRIDCYVHVNFLHEENTQLHFLHSQQILTKRHSSKASRSLGDAVTPALL